METLPGLVFDGAGVGLETLHVLAKVGVLFGKLVDFLDEGFVFGAFLVPAGEAVAAIDYVPGEDKREDQSGNRAEAAAVAQGFRPPV